MRPIPLLLLLAAACGRPSGRPFAVSVLGPLEAKAVSESARLGVPLVLEAPHGSALLSAAGADGRTSPASALFFAATRAAVRGAAGVCFEPPRFPAPHGWTDFPEEWQAFARTARRLLALRPVIEARAAAVPFAVPAGVEARAWRRAGRVYVALVVDGPAPVPLEAAALEPWRALFEPRADAREALTPCAGALCLAPGKALWLEGRPSLP